jgi:hypothetical protein
MIESVWFETSVLFSITVLFLQHVRLTSIRTSSTVYTVILSIWTSSGFVSFYFLFCIALDTATSGPEPSPETQSGRVYCPPGALKVPAAAKVWLGLPAQVVHATATCLLPRCTRTGAQSNTYVLLLAHWWCDPMKAMIQPLALFGTAAACWKSSLSDKLVKSNFCLLAAFSVFWEAAELISCCRS